MSLSHNAHVIGALLAFLCLIGAFRSGWRRLLVENLPTAKTTEVVTGLVELKGTAEPEGLPLCGPLSRQPCLHYKWVVEEKWSYLTTEDGTTRRESGWEKVAGGEEMIPFQLQDAHGSILIRPQGAKVEPVVMFDKTCKRNDPLYYAKGPAKAVSHSKHERRFYEIGIPLHQTLYVIGQARERKDMVAPEIAGDSKSPMFVISAWSEEEVRQRFRDGSLKWVVGGLAVLMGGLFGRDIQALQLINQSWPIYVIAGFGYLLAALFTRACMIYSARVHLRNRMQGAGA